MMAESFVQIPDETGNTGKKMRTVTSEQEGEVVHEHVVEVSNLPDTQPVSGPLTNDELRAADVPVHNVVLEDALTPSAEMAGQKESLSLVDRFDPLHQDSMPIPTAPAGIDTPGQRPGIFSFPVVLPPEQIVDQYIVGFGLNAGALNFNAISPNCPGNGQPWTDCSQYRSIALQINTVGSVTGAISFEGSNDGINALAVTLYDMASQVTAPATSVTLGTSTSRFFSGPLNYRYFRARVSTILAGGSVGCFTMLRMAPFTVPGLGTTTVNAAVAGVQSIGGNIADGTAPTANPAPIGGQDNYGVVTQSAPTSTRPSVPTIATGLTKRVLVDSMGNLGVTTLMDPKGLQGQQTPPVTVTGPQWGFRFGAYAPVSIQESQYTAEDMSITDLLMQILLQLKVTNYYLKEMPLINNMGGVFKDDPDDLISMFTSDEILYQA
jgi:hypothetical protein